MSEGVRIYPEGVFICFFSFKKRGKNMKKRMLSIVCVIAMMSVVISGCGNKKDEKKSSSKKEGIKAYVGTTLFEESLDPIKGALPHGYPFINNALLRVDSNSKYVGDLAKNWEVSKDALTYTFHLNKDIKFSDGSDFDAEDVVFTYETVKKNQADNEYVDLTRLDTVKAIDKETVEFKLKEAYSPFLDTTALLQIVPSDAYDKKSFDTKPIGTGAYKVVQYDADQQIILEVNENYFGKTPDIKKVTLVKMDMDSAFAAAKAGELDIVMVGTNYAKEKISGMTLQRLETMDVRNVSLPVRRVTEMKNSDGKKVKVGNNVTSDLAVRKALAIGIDRQKIIDHSSDGIGISSVNFTDNLVWASRDTYKDKQVVEAKKLLDEAGWKVGKDGIREKAGQKCSFDLYATAGETDRYNLCVALSENAKELGIEIKVKTATWEEIITLQNTSAVLWGWGQYSPTVLSSLFQSNLFLTGGYDNVVGYNNPKVDAKIQEALSANSQESAIASWKEVQKIADADYTNLFLVNIEHCYFVSDNLDISKNTQIPHPHGHGTPIICNMADWKMK